jgi:hypothetical protein
VDQGSVLGIAPRYGLDGPGIKPRWGGRCNRPHPSRPALGPTQLPVQWVPGLLPACKSGGAWPWPANPPCAKVKERVEPYLYSPSGTSWPVQGWNWPCSWTWNVDARTVLSVFKNRTPCCTLHLIGSQQDPVWCLCEHSSRDRTHKRRDKAGPDEQLAYSKEKPLSRGRLTD